MAQITHGPYGTKTTIVADGGTNSAAINMQGNIATHILLPSGLDGTTLEIEGSMDGTNFFDLYDDDETQVTMTVAASRIYQLPSACWCLPYLRFVVGAQTGALTLTVALG